VETMLMIAGAAVTLFHLAGLWAIYDAIVTGRTSQGSVAWVISLLTFPYVALPLYLVVGRRRFHGYVDARRSGSRDLEAITSRLRERLPDTEINPHHIDPRFRVFGKLAETPFTEHNRAQLLIDGEATFSSIFSAIASAESYVLVQFFIIRDDDLGRQLADALIERARMGVSVYLLYDEIGSHKLPQRYVRRLREAGVAVSDFRSTRGRTNRFQLNFRNHRKIVVVDGQVAMVGGHNVGVEYLGRSRRFGPWRDTHIRLEGPSVQAVQLSFLRDWYWARSEIPELSWQPEPLRGAGCRVLVLPSGPADRVETCNLMFVHAIHAARQRLWITSPYFVPDREVTSALQLAALRGVDVRVLLPDNPDHLLVYLSSFSYLEETEAVGIRFYRYLPGFLHQKVMVVDDDLACVGTANLDNRSFRLNFELSILVEDEGFCAETAAMLEHDFAASRRVRKADLTDQPFWFRFAVRAARLFSPLQ